MNWNDIKNIDAPIGKDILVVINRKRLGEELKQEIHVANKTVNNLWIIGNQFGFDMGEVTHWTELPQLP